MRTTLPPRRLAATMAFLTLVTVVALPAASMVIWLFWQSLAIHLAGGSAYGYDLTNLSAAARFAAFGLFFLGALVQAYGLLGIRRTFLEAAAGRSYSDRALGGFRRFAWITVVMVFVGIIQQTGLVAILSISDPARPGALSIQLGSEEVKALFMGLLLVFVARIFGEGKRAKDEIETFL